MNKYLSAIIGILVGIIGLLTGGLITLNSKKKEAEEKAEESKKSQEITEEIAKEVNKPVNIKPIKKKKSGTISKLIIIFTFTFISTSCAIYEPICPSLFVIEKPNNFKDINYKYEDKIGYIFDEDNITELNYQFEWARDTINKYEKQILLYNKFKNGE